MSAMYMLIAFSLLIATGFVFAFIWAINNGQYDDKYTPSIRILFDDDDKTNREKESETKIKKNIDDVTFKDEPSN